MNLVVAFPILFGLAVSSTICFSQEPQQGEAADADSQAVLVDQTMRQLDEIGASLQEEIEKSRLNAVEAEALEEAPESLTAEQRIERLLKIQKAGGLEIESLAKQETQRFPISTRAPTSYRVEGLRILAALSVAVIIATIGWYLKAMSRQRRDQT